MWANTTPGNWLERLNSETRYSLVPSHGYARKHNAKKRNPEQLFLRCPVSGFKDHVDPTPGIDLLALDEALKNLRRFDRSGDLEKASIKIHPDEHSDEHQRPVHSSQGETITSLEFMRSAPMTTFSFS